MALWYTKMSCRSSGCDHFPMPVCYLMILSCSYLRFNGFRTTMIAGRQFQLPYQNKNKGGQETVSGLLFRPDGSPWDAALVSPTRHLDSTATTGHFFKQFYQTQLLAGLR
ncbi:hypothetical protein QQP08_005039 [Theobroma cacao]|nr:hypothetical protein QQP08_005039 [Theobroma cacao]